MTMEKAKIVNNSLQYRALLKRVSVPVENIVWGYIQVEDVKASMCCGNFNTEIGRAIFLDKTGKKHIIQYEGSDPAKKLLEDAKAANPDMAVGYTEENRKKYEA